MSATTKLPQALPHTVGGEKSVLSSLLKEPELMDDAAILTAEHFHLPGHRALFVMLKELHTTSQPIELVSLAQRLLDSGELDRVGGPAALAELYTYAPVSSYFQRHVKMLTEKLACRMTISTAHEMERLAYEAEDIIEILEATSAPISAIHDALTSNRPARDTLAVLSSCIDRFGKLCRGEADPMGMVTSLPSINRAFRGLHGKQTVVISGYPSGGKTALAAQLAMDAALAGHGALFCSLEMPEESIMQRMMAYVAGYPAIAITDPQRYRQEYLGGRELCKQNFRDIRDGAEKILNSPFAVEDLVGANVHQICACIRRAHRKQPLKVVVVDFVQRIRPLPEMRRESREQQLAHASNTLADLSKELDFCLLLPSQLNKEGSAKHAEAINEDADLHLQIVQDRNGPNPTYEHICIAVTKDRHHGKGGTVLPIVLRPEMVRFEEKTGGEGGE